MDIRGDNEDSIKQNLQERLHDAVKQCQTHFGARQEVATESDLRVNTLCIEWEAVLTHGLKKPKTNKLLGSFGKVDTMTGVALWPVIRPFISGDEQERFMRLRYVNSDIGRGRAWLRASINERTLENYLHSILSDISFLKNLYEPGSFLLDEERATILPVMAAGLGSIIFSLAVDVEYLNTPLKNIEVPVILPALRPTTYNVTTNIKPDFATRIMSANDATAANDDDDVVAISNKKTKTKKAKKRSVSPSVNNVIDATTPTNEANFHLSDTPIISVDLTVDQILSRDPSPASFDGTVHEDYSLRKNSTSPFNENSLTSSPALSIQSLNSATEDNNPLFVISHDSQAALEATNFLIEAGVQEFISSELPIATVTSMSESEMKEALKALFKRKQEIEEIHRLTLLELNNEKQKVKEMEHELEELQRELNSKGDTYSQQKQALEKENDLLREQLKRYVGIVQQQQSTDNDERDNSSALSKKLSEMAEMYGELMEFNDHLHKEVQMKDNQIVKMAHTLHLASIPLPVSPDLLPREATEPKKIVEIWIPSVIKRGRGPDVHHVYQIYIKFGTDSEWNVYRRFAEFYEFHKQLQRNLYEINEFQFPPKKVIGRKGSQVIEERRQKLQEYLRFVLDICCKPNVKRKDGKTNGAIIYQGMEKEQFLRVLPFFNDGSIHAQIASNTTTTEHHPPPQRYPSYSGL